MTDQVPDTVYYRGQLHSLYSEPLDSYGQLPRFLPFSTANYRGYEAVWAIVSDALFIVSLTGYVDSVGAVGLEDVFPGCLAPVLADWYTGTLRLQSGRLVTQSESNPLFEREDALEIHGGKITDCCCLNREWRPLIEFTPILNEPIESLNESGAQWITTLKTAGIDRYGDLVQYSVTKLLHLLNLNLEAFDDILVSLTKHGLALDTKLDGWTPSKILSEAESEELLRWGYPNRVLST